MHTMLIFAIVFINLAMVLYTIGVWAERIQLRLKWWHTRLFWLGLVCDTIGTSAMAEVGGALFKLNFHGITGMTAILLMLFHSIWASIVLYKKDEEKIRHFHKFSFAVWIIWLIPMVTGMIFGTSK